MKFQYLLYLISAMCICSMAELDIFGSDPFQYVYTPNFIGTLKLEYVFEIVRHGARAPYSDDRKRFKVETMEMLTPQGMRQRYLLGRYNQMKYANALFDEISKFRTGLTVHSTDVYRTLQSGYSELLGFLSGTQIELPKLKLNQRQAVNSKRGMPPMRVRNATKIDSELGYNAIVFGYVNFPIYTYIETDLPKPEWKDDLNVGSCPLVSKVSDERYNDHTFEDLLHLREELSEPLAKEFNKTKDFFLKQDYHGIASYCDRVYAEKFEGLPQKVNWHDEVLFAKIERVLKSVLLRPFTNETRDLMITKQLTKTMEEIRSANPQDNMVKYRLYSAHDTNVANFLAQIVPYYNWDDIPYAANFMIEGYSTDVHEIFYRIVYNGTPLKLEDQCDGYDYCPADKFIAYMEAHTWSYDTLKDVCFKTEEDLGFFDQFESLFLLAG